jgi:Fe2+ transport system protein FeoA
MKPDRAAVDCPRHSGHGETCRAAHAHTSACTAGCICPLGTLSRGLCGRIVSLAGAPRLQRRLMALGLQHSAELSVLGRAPHHGPLELRAGTVHLMLREDEANDVLVEVTDVPPPVPVAPDPDAHVVR